MAIDDGPLIDNLLPNFGLEGQLVANPIDEENRRFSFPTEQLLFPFWKK